VGDRSRLELADEVEFVRVATSVKGDSTNEHVGTGKSSSKNDGRGEEAESESSGNKSAGNVDTPEECIVLSVVQASGVDEETSHEATPSSNDSGSEFLAFVEQVASSESKEDRAREDNPSNPSFSFVTEEGGVEEEEDHSDGQESTNEEQSRAE
jgi:hypothetical protein